MDEWELVPISALQHYLYCPRQCALIHLEQQWAESRHTAEGRLLHERTDEPQNEVRHGVRTVTAMPLVSVELGLVGQADMVEFHRDEHGERPFPVEFKRGRPKGHRADEVQLCAQALCLEEMFQQAVPAGALFYGKTRRRKDVLFDAALRQLTRTTISAVRAMLVSGITPRAEYESRRCDACSLIDWCQPQVSSRRNVTEWLQRQLRTESD